MKTVIKNADIIIDGENRISGSILVEDDKIVEISDNNDLSGDNVIDAMGNYLMPGMIDIHLHGSYGYDFINNPSLSVNKVAEGLIKEGTTSFMASLTVVSHEELCKLLKEYSEVKNNNGANFLGVHSEGPYLSVKYKALMDEKYLRDFNLKELDEMLDSANGVLKIMTVAPERDGFKEFAAKALKNNATLMIGHSAADSKTALEALKEGCTGFTHLYNAMTQHLHRDPGIVTAAFIDDKAYAELIVDGFHVREDIVKATYKILGPKRICLITDAMLGKGMDDGIYTFSNLKCKKTGNTVQVIETGRIAGSAITMLDAIKNMQRFTGCSINDIVKMSSYNPSIIAKVNDTKGSIEKGKDADLIILDKELNLKLTMVNGKVLYME